MAAPTIRALLDAQIQLPTWRVARLTRRHELHALRPQWEALAARALEPNVFYEPWLMLPALERFHAALPIEVFAAFVRDGEGERLAALLPFQRRGRLFPVRRLLRYYYCLLCTPLLDREFGEAGLREILQLLERDGGRYEFHHLSADGPVFALLSAQLAALEARPVLGGVDRALLRPAGTAQAYAEGALSPKKRHELRRLERRLQELGTLQYDALGRDDDPAPWSEAFLRLEEAGWKGRAASAFACTPAGADFFRRICRSAHARGRLEMYALRLDDRPLAMLCLFTAQGGHYAFRTAYDETFQRYSPGLLLCYWHSCHVHERQDVAWVDSCADPRSELDNRLWSERRRIADLSVRLGLWPRLRQALRRAAALLRPQPAATG